MTSISLRKIIELGCNHSSCYGHHICEKEREIVERYLRFIYDFMEQILEWLYSPISCSMSSNSMKNCTNSMNVSLNTIQQLNRQRVRKIYFVLYCIKFMKMHTKLTWVRLRCVNLFTSSSQRQWDSETMTSPN